MAYLDVTFPLNSITEIGMSGHIEPPPIAVASTNDGKVEQRIQVASSGRYIAQLTTQGRTLAEIQTLWDFMQQVGGSLYSFRFHDPDPYFNTVTGQTIGSGDGTTTAFQLVKSFSTYDHSITKPLTSTIYVDGTEETARVSVGSNTGIATFSADITGSITGATSANPTELTKVAHGLTTGDTVALSTFTGDWVALNGNRYVITKTGNDTFTVPVNASAFTAYSSNGGTFHTLPQTGETITADITFDFQVRFVNSITSQRVSPATAHMMGEITMVEVTES